jgi:hypothetical protein
LGEFRELVLGMYGRAAHAPLDHAAAVHDGSPEASGIALPERQSAYGLEQVADKADTAAWIPAKHGPPE